jgi:hypothetical protein
MMIYHYRELKQNLLQSMTAIMLPIMLVGENKDVFQLACKNREHAGRFGLDQFSDKARNLNGTKIWKHFGWKDLCLTSKIKFLWSTRHGQERHRIFFFLNSETHCIYS